MTDVFFDFRNMEEVVIGMAALDTYNHFIAHEANEQGVVLGEFACRSIQLYYPRCARKLMLRVVLTAARNTLDHREAYYQMLERSIHIPADLSFRIQREDRDDDVTPIVKYTREDGLALSDEELYRACAFNLELRDDDYDIGTLQADRARLMQQWLAPPAPLYIQDDGTDCEHPNCTDVANPTGLCDIHTMKLKKQHAQMEYRRVHSREKRRKLRAYNPMRVERAHVSSGDVIARNLTTAFTDIPNRRQRERDAQAAAANANQPH
jgi:hypothetical protein